MYAASTLSRRLDTVHTLFYIILTAIIRVGTFSILQTKNQTHRKIKLKAIK